VARDGSADGEVGEGWLQRLKAPRERSAPCTEEQTVSAFVMDIKKKKHKKVDQQKKCPCL